MTVATRYDPSAPLAEGRTVIEAGAGTGKTHTITAAVTRLVAEEGLGLEEILVVTFTRAATAELKDRIRKRMVVTLRALEGRLTPGPVDEHMRVLLDATPERRACYAARLDDALTGFDRAQIFTIHGFARRLLLKLGFRSRLPADLEPGEIDELLLRRAAGDLVMRRFTAADGIEVVAPEDVAAIGKALAGAPDARILPEATDADGTPRIRAEIAGEMGDLLVRRLRAGGMATFDDSLVEARDALADPRVGAHARDLLRRRYSVALVDESQDTDPIQWQVIRAVFDDSRLVIIGDPKQSIYAFRGADLESYLAAADNAPVHRTLEVNWRSDGPLITALDTLFAGASFGDDRITYHRVQPPEHHRVARIDGVRAPLEIRRFSDDFPLPRYRRGPPYFHIDPARRAVAADVADEIVRRLTTGVTLTDRDGAAARPIGPGDLAVLCRTRQQVDMVRDQLGLRGVPSVAARTGGVFATPAAEDWRRFLLAVERPNRTDYVRMAALSKLVGLALGEVADLGDEDVLGLQHRFYCWQTLLQDHGVPALVDHVDRTTDLAARVLAEPDGERTMTDLSHIAEEMHGVWRRGRIGSLVVWLEAAMEEAERNAKANVEDPESRQRRLETDAAAVQVQTIHAAKGLEYPVVMAPFLWDIPRIQPAIPLFHDSEPVASGEPRRRLIDVGGPGSRDFDAHRSTAMAEEAAEEGRLLYVALTRAKHHLVVWWIANTKNSAGAKLHELFTRHDPTRTDIQPLIDAAQGAIDQIILTELGPPMLYEPEERARSRLDRARLGRSLDYEWRRVSFTSLTPDDPLTGAVDITDQPDRIDENAAGETPPAIAGEPTMAELPRGARFGSLVHDILERVPFHTRDLPEAIRDELARATRHLSWDFDADSLVTGLASALRTPLGPEADAPTLRGLEPARILKEMNFELPVRTGSSAVSLRDIAAVALDHLPHDDPHRPYVTRLRRLDPSRFRGYLAGAVDLTTSLPVSGGDRYVVIDYKSNALPALGDTPSPIDYGPRALAGAMHEGNYVLQALLYQVALHRYLHWRLDGYDPDRHLGGSMYLFVRGMIGPDTPVVDGERCGVARWSPPVRMIAAVSDLFAGRAP